MSEKQSLSANSPGPGDDVAGEYLTRRENTPNENLSNIMMSADLSNVDPLSGGEKVSVQPPAAPVNAGAIYEKKSREWSDLTPDEKRARSAWSLINQGVKADDALAEVGGGVTDPWFDPITVFSGAGVATGLLTKSLLKGAVSGIVSTVGDAAVSGIVTEKVGEKTPGGALPLNLVLGLVSGATFEAGLEKSIVKVLGSQGVKATTKEVTDLTKEVIGKIKSGEFSDIALGKLLDETGSIEVKKPDVSALVAKDAHEELSSVLSEKIQKTLKLSNAPLVEIKPKASDAGSATVEEATQFFELQDVPKFTEKYAININLSKIETPDDIKKTILDISRAYEDGIQTARRGKITQEQTNALADDLGMSVDQLLSRRAGAAFNAEEALAARKIMVASASHLKVLAVKVSSPDASDIDKFAFRKALNLHYGIQAQVSGMTAEAGRALAQFKMMVGEDQMVRNMRNTLDRIIATESEGSTERIASILATLDNPSAITTTTRKLRQPGTLSMLRELWINGLLSGPITHTKNMLSNSLVAITQPVERFNAAVIGKLFETVGAGKAEIAIGEPFYQLVGVRMAFEDAFRLVGKLSNLASDEGMRPMLKSLVEAMSDQDGKIEHKAAITGANALNTWWGKGIDKLGGGGMLARGMDLLGQMVRIPGAALGAEDVVFKGIGYRMELWSQAYRKAVSEGLSGDTLTSRIIDIANDPPTDIMKVAQDAADYQTFTRKLGEVGTRMSGFLNSHPAFSFIVPFIKTPTNIFKYFGERTPLALLSKAVWDDITEGGAKRDLALSKISLGSMVIALGAFLGYEGKVTGGGPKERTLQEAWRNTGWRPYSIKVDDKYYGFGGLEPLGTLLGIAADIGEITKRADEGQLEDVEHIISAAAIALSKNVTSKTFLQGVAQFSNFLAEPENRWSSISKNYARSIVPASLQQFNRTEIDPVVRQTRDMVDEIKAAIPGLSETLPPRRNVWGEPVMRDEALGPDVTSPIPVSKDKQSGVDDEIKRLGISLRTHDRFLHGVEMTPQEQDHLIRLTGNEFKDPSSGKGLKETLEEVIRSPEYQAASDGKDGGKAKIIKDIYHMYRNAAEGQVEEIYPDLSGAIQTRKVKRAEKLGF